MPETKCAAGDIRGAGAETVDKAFPAGMPLRTLLGGSSDFRLSE